MKIVLAAAPPASRTGARSFMAAVRAAHRLLRDRGLMRASGAVREFPACAGKAQDNNRFPDHRIIASSR